MLNLSRAFDFANDAHRGQFRNAPLSCIPYIKHPLDVAKRLLLWGEKDQEVLEAAMLHDVVEDTPITIDDVQYEFGWKVANLVKVLTNLPGEGKDKYLNRILKESELESLKPALLIKVADRYCNSLDFWESGNKAKSIRYFNYSIDIYHKVIKVYQDSHINLELLQNDCFRFCDES